MNHPLTWQGDAPYSAAFDDIYFNPLDGLAETRHVFLEGNTLNERFTNAHHFTIAELGFGTGLNLLAAWQLFRQIAPAHAMLHYVSFERYPLERDAMLRAASHWPELQPLAQTLFLRLNLFGEGIYRLHAPQLSLTLVIGDATQMLPQMDFAADAWFLDGFAPAKNPDMWSDELLLQVAHHTKAGGTASTFTSAGAVRRALAAGGFSVQKVKGYGRKREMTIAHKAGTGDTPQPPQMVRIAGGGIAGCSAAYSLARRGIAVELYEPAGIASGASGNAAGALYPLLHKQPSPALHGYWDALRYLHHLLPGRDVPHALCGMLKLPIDDDDAALLPTLPKRLGLPPEALRWLDATEASAVAGLPIAQGGLFIPASGRVNVAALCHDLMQHPLITLHPHSLPVDDAAIPTLFANGAAAAETFPHLTLGINRGQVSHVDACHVTQPLGCVVSHRGYAIGLEEGGLLIGATYDRGNPDCTLRGADHAENLALTHRFLPGLLSQDAVAASGRASLRTVTPDRMPLVGLAAPHRYISTGHGSRGLLSGPLAGEWLADLLCHTPLPLRRESATAWDAQRPRANKPLQNTSSSPTS